jgi:hypothetical protein
VSESGVTVRTLEALFLKAFFAVVIIFGITRSIHIVFSYDCAAAVAGTKAFVTKILAIKSNGIVDKHKLSAICTEAESVLKFFLGKDDCYAKVFISYIVFHFNFPFSFKVFDFRFKFKGCCAVDKFLE